MLPIEKSPNPTVSDDSKGRSRLLEDVSYRRYASTSPKRAGTPINNLSKLVDDDSCEICGGAAED